MIRVATGRRYIEMMCAEPREDNALARSILNAESSQRTAETLRERGAFENDDDDDSVQYENWTPKNSSDGSGCLLSSSVVGYASYIDRLFDRYLRLELGLFVLTPVDRSCC